VTKGKIFVVSSSVRGSSQVLSIITSVTVLDLYQIEGRQSRWRILF
jgi:hypothetical protein